MGNRYLEIFQGKRSDYYAAIASVSNIPSIGRFVCPFILFTFSSSWRYTAFFWGGDGRTTTYQQQHHMHAAGGSSLAGQVGNSIGEKGAAAAGTAPGGVDGSPDASVDLAQSVAASDMSAAWRKPGGGSSNLPVHQKNANQKSAGSGGGDNVGGGVSSHHNNGGYGGGGCGGGGGRGGVNNSGGGRGGYKGNNYRGEGGHHQGGGIREGPHTGYIRLRGLPFNATKQDLLDFFREFKPIESSVMVTYRVDGRATGEGYAAFDDAEDAKGAMTMHKRTIGSRYIELFISNKEEYTRNVARSAPC